LPPHNNGSTEISWAAGKNLCVEEKRMKPRGKSRGPVKTKVVPKESFFNFFSALEMPADDDGMDEEEVRACVGVRGGLRGDGLGGWANAFDGPGGRMDG
jgi:hypothetical protein